MLKTGHRLAGALCGANMAAAGIVLGGADPLMPLVAGGLAVAVSTWNDWDLNYYRDSWNPAIGLIRQTAKIGYGFHTAKDRATWERRARVFAATWEPGDLHRGPTHCLEWCLAFGLIVAGLAQLFAGPFGVAGWWLGLGVFVGTASHVFADMLTPSGVPVSAIYNWLVHGEVWKRHAVGWRVPFEDRALVLHLGPIERPVHYLTWIRWPSVVPADGARVAGCRPGICRSDRAGDHLFQLYLMVPATIVSMLFWIGGLGPVASVLTWGLV